MKKLLIAIMAFVYLGVSSGVVINMHYCMNKLSCIKVEYQKEDKCSNCGMKAKDGCCKDELKVVKLADEHKYTDALQLIPSVFTPVFYRYNIPAKPLALKAPQPFNKGYLPPDNPLYLQHCVFRV